MSADNPQYNPADILRVAGFTEAADLLSKLPTGQPSAPAEPVEQPRAMTPAEAQHAAGQELLETLQASVAKNTVTINAEGWL